MRAAANAGAAAGADVARLFALPPQVNELPNNGLGNNPLRSINSSVLVKRGRYSTPIPNNGLGNNPLSSINSSVLVKRGKFSSRKGGRAIRKSRNYRKTRRN
jgi:hypothetical protein